MESPRLAESVDVEPTDHMVEGRLVVTDSIVHQSSALLRKSLPIPVLEQVGLLPAQIQEATKPCFLIYPKSDFPS